MHLLCAVQTCQNRACEQLQLASRNVPMASQAFRRFGLTNSSIYYDIRYGAILGSGVVRVCARSHSCQTQWACKA